MPTSALGWVLRRCCAECVEGVGGPCVRTLGWLGAQVSGSLRRAGCPFSLFLGKGPSVHPGGSTITL